MQDQQIRSWLSLHRTENLSGNALCRLIAATAQPEAIYQLSSAELDALEIRPVAQRSLRKPPDQQQLERDFALVQNSNIHIVPLGAENYPALLSQIADPPPILYVKGDVSLLNKPQLAMVGSRNTSRSGRENAFRFAREFASAGFIVTSGLALGIDTECHQGALASNGHTIGVLGTGIDIVYPARNRPLFDDIAYKGAIISEFPIGLGPRKSLFPKRNRIISGMSLGVLVVEAALRSGSLITARCALEQGREVFAIPGSIHNTGSRGCHALIQQGAKLVQNAADVLEELQGWMPQSEGLKSGAGVIRQQVNKQLQSQPELCADGNISQQEQQLIELLGYDPAPIDLLLQRSGWALPQLTSLLTTLELKGLIENRSGCYQRTV